MMERKDEIVKLFYREAAEEAEAEYPHAPGCCTAPSSKSAPIKVNTTIFMTAQIMKAEKITDIPAKWKFLSILASQLNYQNST